MGMGGEKSVPKSRPLCNQMGRGDRCQNGMFGAATSQGSCPHLQTPLQAGKQWKQNQQALLRQQGIGCLNQLENSSAS